MNTIISISVNNLLVVWSKYGHFKNDFYVSVFLVQ
nr:MAG TPA: hypothetical protein [Caudoviricetes sp.]